MRSTTFVCNSVAFVQLNDDDGSGEISGPVCSNASPNERVFMGRSCPFFPPIFYDALESWDDRETSWLLCVPVLFSSRLEWTTASSTQTIFLSPVVFIARLKGELDEIRRTKWKEQFSFIFFIFILLWSFLLSSYSHFSPICTVTVVFDRTQEKKNTRRIVQLQARNKINFFLWERSNKIRIKEEHLLTIFHYLILFFSSFALWSGSTTNIVTVVLFFLLKVRFWKDVSLALAATQQKHSPSSQNTQIVSHTFYR